MKLIEYIGKHEKKIIKTDYWKITFESSKEDKRKIAMVDDGLAARLVKFSNFREVEKKEQKQESFLDDGIEHAIKDNRKKIDHRAKKNEHQKVNRKL